MFSVRFRADEEFLITLFFAIAKRIQKKKKKTCAVRETPRVLISKSEALKTKKTKFKLKTMFYKSVKFVFYIRFAILIFFCNCKLCSLHGRNDVERIPRS